MLEQEQFTLKQLRSLSGMSQRELADRAGISVKTVYHYETNVAKLRNAKYETLKTLAEILDVRVDNIFLGDTSENPK